MKNSQAENHTLHLTIEQKWLKLIFLGVKRNEYREIKPYWLKRLFITHSTLYNEFVTFSTERELKAACKTLKRQGLKKCNYIPRFYDKIKFRGGYGANSPIIIIEYKTLLIRKGIEEYGAPKYPVFDIELGKILETRNIPQDWVDTKNNDFDNDDFDNDDFEPCSQCDGHDACVDFGCAFKLGLGHLVKDDKF